MASRCTHLVTSRDVSDQPRELGCDPTAGMARLVQDDSLPAALHARISAELLSYIASRRKAMELSGPGSAPIEVQTVKHNLSALSAGEKRHLLDLIQQITPGHAP